jgi:hypothetical protein
MFGTEYHGHIIFSAQTKIDDSILMVAVLKIIRHPS